MSLARAFSRRSNKRPDISLPLRFGSLRGRRTDEPLKRPLISGPIQLVSTTNMLSFNAPDVALAQQGQLTLTTIKSIDESMASSASIGNRSSADCTDSDVSLVSDNSTVASSSAGSSPSPDRDSACYFSTPTFDVKPVIAEPVVAVAAPDDTIDAIDFTLALAPLPVKSLKRSSSVQLPAPSSLAAPQLPKRALSHSKREHERLARQRSIRGSQLGAPRSISSLNSAASTASISPNRSPISSVAEHPFSSELEQLSEVAEDFAMLDLSNAELEADTAVMQTKGLLKFSAEDYTCEIAPLVIGAFQEDVVRPGSGWF